MKQSVWVLAVMLSIFLLPIELTLTDIAKAGGPFFVTRNGEPFRWRLDPVPYTPDQGPLGQLDNATAGQLVAGAFQTWEAVETATIRFEQRGQLDVDVTGANIMDFLNRVARGINPIIFDHDGSVIDAIVGAGASQDIIGFASPTLRPPGVTRGEFRQGWAVFNGLFAGQRIPTEKFRATVVHEIGHFIGLGHTQLNARRALDGSSWNDRGVPTMFPILVSEHQAHLHPDDMAAVSSIYPDPSFALSTGAIQGRVLMPNGVAGFQGANVVARRLGFQPVAISSVSGDLFTSNWRPMGGHGSANSAWRGFYRIGGLPPGRYTVEVEPINPSFTGGSVVGPLDPPTRLIGGPEFYSGMSESNHDGSRRIALVKVEAGAVVEDVDIILDGHFPPNDLCSNATPISGSPFTDRLQTRNAAAEDDDPIHTCTLRVDSNSVWYSFTPESSGVIVADTMGSDYDTLLSAYTGPCGRVFEVACNDHLGPDNRQSQIVFGAMAGRTYLIEVNDADDRIGGGELNFSFRFEPHTLVSEQEPNETLVQAQKLMRPGAVLGDVAPGDPGVVTIMLRGRPERLEDVYVFTLDRSAKVQINLAIERFGVEIELVLLMTDGSTTTILGDGSSIGQPMGIGPVDLMPGTYYVGVSVNDRETARGRTVYTLAIN